MLPIMGRFMRLTSRKKERKVRLTRTLLWSVTTFTTPLRTNRHLVYTVQFYLNFCCVVPLMSFFLSTQKYSEYSLLSEKLSKVCLLTESKIQLHSVKAFHTISLWVPGKKQRKREGVYLNFSFTKKRQKSFTAADNSFFSVGKKLPHEIKQHECFCF